MSTICITLLDDETADVEHCLPARWEICDRCRGNGVVDNPAFKNGLSREDFDEDPEFEEDYRRGAYDVSCPECEGQGKTKVVDTAALNPQQREVYAKYEEQQREEAAYDREYDYTRRAENGFRESLDKELPDVE